jgi:outer membrane receptor protein involved in Fe transport
MPVVQNYRGAAHVYIVLLLSLSPAVFAQEAGEDEVTKELNVISEDVEMELIDEFAFLEDAGMVESAARHRQEIGMSPSAVTVLTREDVEASGATTITDLLRLVPGMDVSTVSPGYISLCSRLPWTNSNICYQLLIDGRDAMNEVMGMVPWLAETISLDDIERIEILRGPASSMYGASALAGVVSVTTRVVPKETSASVHMLGGEVGTLQFGARGSTRIGSWGFSLSGGGDLANSYNLPRVGDKELWKLRALVEYTWSETERFRLDFSMSQGIGKLNSSAGLIDMDMGIRALRAAYESRKLKGRLYWYYTPFRFTLEAPLEYMGIRLAKFAPVEADGHTLDGEVQWTLPEFYKPLLIMVGGGGRFSWIGSDQLLDGDTYADITSADYHQPGISHWEWRTGAFVHAEYEPAEWVTLSGSLRFDYNTETDVFLSPRLAAVFRPFKGQYLRVGVARAFRKPAFIETRLHPMAEFPDDSPITGDGQENFQDFLAKVISASDVNNEELVSFEFGYLGLFLDGSLSVAVDVYYNQVRNSLAMTSEIVAGEQGLPDLDESYMRPVNQKEGTDIHGSELVVRYQPVKSISLMASWAYREVFDRMSLGVANSTPKNLVTVGGRFRSESGLVGSLYVFSRSEFWGHKVASPEGLLAPFFSQHLDNFFLILGKLGWRWQTGEGFGVETGLKLFLPFSPFSGPLFRYHEDPGGVTASGRFYGGQQLRRVVTAYLEGSF